ncbi:MAG: outer membrane protein assembly factor BamE [Salinisphaera sp.]|nr:outer membrane protein assembly factor BamE [Salinisphaera sp.]MDN5937315.1 outer membrane protein assembly factor BamE [Salinisphaera sp.]
MRIAKAVTTLLLAVAIGGCSLPVLFRVPILQGNVLTEKQVKQLEMGMTPPQVRFLLGTPLVRSEFVPNRWDYIFYYRDRRGDVRESRLTLYFQNGKLARVQGDEEYKSLLPEMENDIDPDLLEPSLQNT